MMMGLIVLLIVLGVAYFHYVQGFFSATLSAMFAIIAAVAAMGFHEWIVRNFVGAYVPDLGSALVLVALFALVYIILRSVFDQYVPGNLTFPLMIDRIGGAAMGAVAGVFAAGVLVIATETLPFGASIGGYSRFAVSSDPIDAKVGKPAQDVQVNELLQSENLSPSEAKHLLIPVDDIVVNTTWHLSDNGSLAGPFTVASVHPAFLDELFFQRLGIQNAAKHVALNSAKENQVNVTALYCPLPTDPQPQVDADFPGPGFYPARPPIPPLMPPSDLTSNYLLIARTTIGGGAVDKDNKVRLSPSSVRLVIKGRNFMPIGTYDTTTAVQIRRNRPDDFIVMDGGGTIDLVFLIPNDGDYVVPADAKNAKNGPVKLASGAFLEVKRFGDVEMGMMAKREEPPILSEKAPTVLRKKDLPNSSKAKAIEHVTTPPPGSAAPETGSLPFEYDSKQISSALPAPVNVGTHAGDEGDVSFPAGTATLKEGKLAKFELKPTLSIPQLGQGDDKIDQMYVQPGSKIVQVTVRAGAEHWEWADKLDQFEVVDNGGKSFKPHGAWVVVKVGANFEDRIAAKYDESSPLAKFGHTEGTPTDVHIFFVIGDGQPQSLKFDGKVIASLN